MKEILNFLLMFYGVGKVSSQISISDIPYTQNNFDDMTFLKEEIKHKNIVYLGEEWHFTETFSQMKKRIVKYLHQELGYNVILFGSSFQGAWIAEMEYLEDKTKTR